MKKMPPKTTPRSCSETSVFGMSQIQILAFMLVVCCSLTAISVFILMIFTVQNAQLQLHIQQMDAALQDTSKLLIDKTLSSPKPVVSVKVGR